MLDSSDIEKLKLNELEIWLKTHNRTVANTYAERDLEKKFHNNLIAKVGGETESMNQLSEIIAFSSSLHDNVGHTKHDNPLTLQTGQAVRHVLKQKRNHERFAAGMDVYTLLTEHKRKVILKALTSSAEIPESKAVAQKKLSKYLSKTEGDYLNDADNKEQQPTASATTISPNKKILKPLGTTSLTSSQNMDSHTSVTSNTHKTQSEILLTGDSTSFTPKWEHYSAMRTRWGQIQPQIKHLVDESSIMAVTSSDQTHIKAADGAKISGNVLDVQFHTTLRGKKSERQDKIATHSHKLLLEELNKGKNFYRPQHGVRY